MNRKGEGEEIECNYLFIENRKRHFKDQTVQLSVQQEKGSSKFMIKSTRACSIHA